MKLINRTSTPRSGRGRYARLFLFAYPVLFLLGSVGIGFVVLTTNDPSLFTSGLVSGFILVGLSIAALLVYPALSLDASTRHTAEETAPSLRPYLAVGLGIPVGLGLVVEVLGMLSGGGLMPVGFLGGFVAVAVHPVTACLASVGYLIRTRGTSSR
jgi:hypothetical protein